MKNQKNESGLKLTRVTETLSRGNSSEERPLEFQANIESIKGDTLKTQAFDGVIVPLAPEPENKFSSLTDSERRLILETWNATDREFPEDKGVHVLFEERAAKCPEAVAVIHHDEKLTYRQLDAKASSLAVELRERGVRPRDVVAILCERSIALVIAELAILKTGAVYLPLDATFPEERLAFMVKDSGTRLILERRSAGETRFGIPVLDLEIFAFPPESSVSTRVQGEDNAYIMYTSGSTGLPKGVIIPHRGITRLVINNGYADFNEWDRIAFASNPAFDASTMEVWGALLNGGTLITIDKETLMDPPALSRALSKSRTSVLFLTSAIFSQYGHVIPEAFSHLRYLIVGGDKCESAVCKFVLDAGKPQHLINGYGPTETTTFALTHRVSEASSSQTDIPIGKPISNTKVYILDEFHNPVPVGTKGELYIGGKGVANGYLNRPELTAERFLIDPFSHAPGARMYKTGDLAKWLPDGTIEFMGRIDFQVKIRGFRIELGEIEDCLLKLSKIREAVVVAREVHGEKRLVAYYVSEKEVGTGELRHHLSGSLPAYMIPSAFVRMNAFQLSSNGKLDRKALPPPDMNAFAAKAFEPTVGGIEEKLAAIWAELLKVERVGRNDSFFELGGHSLLATRIVALIRKRLNLDASVESLFKRPVLRDFATTLTSAGPEPLKLKRQRGLDTYPLTHAQSRMVYLNQTAGGGNMYNVPFTYRYAPGSFNFEDFKARLDHIVMLHEILRTTIVNQDGSLKMLVHPKPIHLLESVDCDETVIQHKLVDAASSSFDVLKDPLLRVTVFQTQGQWVYVMIIIHHVIFDGWSANLLFSQLHGRSMVESAPFQYGDYALWEKEYLKTDHWRQHETHWIEKLNQDLPALGIKGDLPGCKKVLATLENQLNLNLPEGSQRRIRDVYGVTNFCFLLGIYALLLHENSGDRTIVIGSPTANRELDEASAIIGLFVNTLPHIIDINPSASAQEFIAGVMDVVSADLSHQAYPYDEMMRLVHRSDPSRENLFDAFFMLENITTSNNDDSKEHYPVPIQGLKFKLNLIAKPRADENFHLYLEYNSDEFSEPRMQGFFQRYMAIARLILENPTKKIREVLGRQQGQALAAEVGVVDIFDDL